MIFCGLTFILLIVTALVLLLIIKGICDIDGEMENILRQRQGDIYLTYSDKSECKRVVDISCYGNPLYHYVTVEQFLEMRKAK
jgi:hypothetical protein